MSQTEAFSGVHWGRIRAFVENGRLVETRPVDDDPHPSPMVGAVADAVNHKARIKAPAVRRGWLEKRRDSDRSQRGVEPFVEVTWDEAIALVADEIRRVIKDHGNDALFAGSGWGSAGRLHSPKPLFGRLFNPLGGYVAQTTNWSFAAAGVLIPRVVGTIAPVIGPLSTWQTIAQHTELMVIFGGAPRKNTQVNEGGALRHRTATALDTLAQSKVEMVYLSPQKTDLAAGPGARWIPVRPGTDAAVMLGIAHTLIVEDLYDKAFIDTHCVGFEKFRPYILGNVDGIAKDAAWASAISGVDAGSISDLARRMAKTRTLIAMSWSVQRADHGEQPCWLTVVLAALLGQIGLPGGGFALGYGAIDGLGHQRGKVSAPSMPVPPNPVSFAVPVAKITDMLLNPGKEFAFNGKTLRFPDVRLAYWCGGNPFHHNPDLNRLLLSWRQLETIVVQDPWWTPAARHADIVLPAATPLERNDLGASSWDNGAFAMQQVVPPLHAARSDYAFFQSLAHALGIAERFSEGRDEMAWIAHLYDGMRDKAALGGIRISDFDEFWRTGFVEFPQPDPGPEPFAAFRADPAAYPLKTPSGKIEIFSETIASFGYAGCPGHPVWFEPQEWHGSDLAKIHPLHLLSNQPLTRLHSQLDMTGLSADAKIGGREPVVMHADDALARGIADGDVVRIFNARGQCLAGARLTRDILRGVVQIATGAWYDPVKPGLVGSLDAHGSANVLTRDGTTSQLAQGGVQQSTLVEIERFVGAVPIVQAFEPPLVVCNA